jgi:hypothetical protein
MEEFNADMVYKFLELYIAYCLKRNDRRGVLGAEDLPLCKILTDEQKESISDLSMSAFSEIEHRFGRGELTPMDVDEENKVSAYTTYYYYLTKKLWNENQEKAKQLALQVYEDIKRNKHVCNNTALLERYRKIYEDGDVNGFP